MRTIDCDSCLRRFTPDLREEWVEGGRRQEFDCPHCGTTFPVAFISTEGLEVRRHLRRAVKRGDTARAERLKTKLARHVTGLASQR